MLVITYFFEGSQGCPEQWATTP